MTYGTRGDGGLLDALGETDRRRILDAARRRSFKRGEPLFREGDPGTWLFLITEGSVAVSGLTPMGDHATFNFLGTGDVLGEMAVLDGSTRMATAVAVEPTRVLVLHRDQVHELRRGNTALDHFFADVIARHVRRLSGLLLEALFVPADQRVVRRIQALVDLYGDGKPGTEIPVTQTDLASLAGTSRATVNRVLRGAEEAGEVALRRGRICVLEPERLATRAQ